MNVWAWQIPSAWPWLLLLLPLLWFGWRVAGQAMRRRSAWLGPREASICGVRQYVRTRALAAAFAFAAFAVALLRPVTVGRDADFAPDIVLCVDVSRSMAAGDGDPTRFASLQQQVEVLLDGALGSRFAIVAFGGQAAVVTPLTADRDAASWLMQELAPGALLRGGSDLRAALECAAASLQRADSRGDIVLLTDGEDRSGDGARAAQSVHAMGCRVHCIGYGREAGSKIVVERDGEQAYLQDEAGQDVITRLDVASLRGVAEAGGGAFYPATDVAQLLTLWRDDWRVHAARRQLADGEGSYVPQFVWPLLVGVLLLMLRVCLPERRR